MECFEAIITILIIITIVLYVTIVIPYRHHGIYNELCILDESTHMSTYDKRKQLARYKLILMESPVSYKTLMKFAEMEAKYENNED